MHTAMRKAAKNYHLLKHPKYASIIHLADLRQKANTIYSQSIKKIKKKPYQSGGVFLGASILTGLLVWYRFLK